MDVLRSGFSFLKKKHFLIIVLLLLIILLNLNSIKPLIFAAAFIVISGFSKFYHRFFRSTLGVDTILYFSLIISLKYGPMLGILVAWPSLFLADFIANRLSHTSIATLIGLTAVILAARIFTFTAFSLVVLTLMYETIMVIQYYMLGSRLDKIGIFLISNLLFNLALISSLTLPLSKIM